MYNNSDFDKLKKEYIAIKEELNKYKLKYIKTINSFNMLVGEFKIKKSQLRLAELRDDHENIKKLTNELENYKLAINKVELSMRDKEVMFEDIKRNLNLKMTDLEIDPNIRKDIRLFEKRRKLENLKNKENRIENLKHIILNNNTLKNSFKNMISLYPDVLRYSLEINDYNLDPKYKEILQEKLLEAQQNFYDNQKSFFYNLEKNNLDINPLDFDNLVLNNFGKDRINLNLVFKKELDLINKEKNKIAISIKKDMDNSLYLNLEDKSDENIKKIDSDNSMVNLKKQNKENIFKRFINFCKNFIKERFAYDSEELDEIQADEDENKNQFENNEKVEIKDKLDIKKEEIKNKIKQNFDKIREQIKRDKNDEKVESKDSINRDNKQKSVNKQEDLDI